MKYTFENGKTIEMTMEQAVGIRDSIEVDNCVSCYYCPLYTKPFCDGIPHEFQCRHMAFLAGIVCSTEGDQE